MAPDIFIDDFERTENTDYLHGVIGRALILATRFDSMCNELAIAIDVTAARIHASFTEESFDTLAEAATTKYRTLNSNIKALGMPENVSDALHKARISRNEIAHSLADGLTGCLDSKIRTPDFLFRVSQLVDDLVLGDVVISLLVSTFNKAPIPNDVFINSYKSRIQNWISHEYD